MLNLLISMQYYDSLLAHVSLALFIVLKPTHSSIVWGNELDVRSKSKQSTASHIASLEHYVMKAAMMSVLYPPLPLCVTAFKGYFRETIT